ncbi:hypothetical protein ES703_22812 [subsurface metagenome]
MKNRRGQVWVETIIYTLIAFALIGLVLAFVKPKIEEIQDKGIIEQSISVLEEIDLIIKTLGDPGNQRVVNLGISKGIFNIDGENNKLFFELESRHTYSEPGKNVTIRNIIVLTEKRGKINDVTLTRDYEGEYDITYKNTDELKKIGKTSTSYTLLIANKGENALNKTIINIEVLN